MMQAVAQDQEALLIREPLYDGESLGGYLLRLAHLNGLSNPAWLANLGLPAVAAAGLGAARWCCACLEKPSPMWAAKWTAEPAICMQHLCWLEDRCPKCNCRMSWRNARLLACRCGADLRSGEVRFWNSDVVTVFASEVQGPNQSWMRLAFDSRWRVAKLIGALDMHGLLGKPLKRASAASVEVERRLITVGAHVILGSSQAFTDLFDRMRLTCPGNGGTQLVSQAFPGLLSMIRKRLDQEGGDWLMERLHAYVGASLESGAPIQWRQRATMSLAAAISVGKQLGVRPERVASLAVQFGVTPTHRIGPSGRRMLMIAPSDVERLRRGLTDDLSMSAAADRFGLSVSRLTKLLDAGCLNRSKEGVSAASIAALVEKVARRAGLLHDQDPVDMLTLPEAMRLFVPAAHTVDFIDAIGISIPVIKTSVACTTMRDLFVRRGHVRGLYAGLTGGGVLSIPDVARALCLRQDVTYHLVRVGLLKASLHYVGRRLANCVRIDDLNKFEMQYAPLARLAAEAGVDRRSAPKWGRANNLHFVSGPSIDGGRQFIVRYRVHLAEASVCVNE